MDRKKYEKTNEYRESVEIIKGFIREMSKIQIKKYRFLSDIIDA